MTIDQTFALVGIIATLIAGFGPSLLGRNEKPSLALRCSILGIGFGLTGILVGAFGLNKASTPQLEPEIVSIELYTIEQLRTDIDNKYVIPKRGGHPEKKARTIVLESPCADPYDPIVAWHNVKVQFPNTNLLYEVKPYYKDGKLHIDVRANPKVSGYALVDILTLCSGLN